MIPRTRFRKYWYTNYFYIAFKWESDVNDEERMKNCQIFIREDKHEHPVISFGDTFPDLEKVADWNVKKKSQYQRTSQRKLHSFNFKVKKINSENGKSLLIIVCFTGMKK